MSPWRRCRRPAWPLARTPPLKITDWSIWWPPLWSWCCLRSRSPSSWTALQQCYVVIELVRLDPHHFPVLRHPHRQLLLVLERPVSLRLYLVHQSLDACLASDLKHGQKSAVPSGDWPLVQPVCHHILQHAALLWAIEQIWLEAGESMIENFHKSDVYLLHEWWPVSLNDV